MRKKPAPILNRTLQIVRILDSCLECARANGFPCPSSHFPITYQRNGTKSVLRQMLTAHPVCGMATESKDPAMTAGMFSASTTLNSVVVRTGPGRSTASVLVPSGLTTTYLGPGGSGGRPKIGPVECATLTANKRRFASVMKQGKIQRYCNQRIIPDRISQTPFLRWNHPTPQVRVPLIGSTRFSISQSESQPRRHLHQPRRHRAHRLAEGAA